MTTVKEKDVAARFRRGDVLLKPQYEPDDGRITMRDATRTVRPPLPFSAETAHKGCAREGADAERQGR